MRKTRDEKVESKKIYLLNDEYYGKKEEFYVRQIQKRRWMKAVVVFFVGYKKLVGRRGIQIMFHFCMQKIQSLKNFTKD